MIKFLPSYVGSKAWWVSRLPELSGRHFVEAFCGSSVLSANLASSAVLIDNDPYIYKILANYDEQIVPAAFGPEEYFAVRSQPDWWRYAYCLQKCSFSGVFRYSKNGYNVPIKHRNVVDLRAEYAASRTRWEDLKPTVVSGSYEESINYLQRESVLVLDPPYEKAQASYNGTFDYERYWQFIYYNENACDTIIVFDSTKNLPFAPTMTRKMRVNGKHEGSVEGMFIFEKSIKEGEKGEQKFLLQMGSRIEKADGIKFDFIHKETNKSIELKSDYYNTEKTPNFFMERYSSSYKQNAGGPWRALNDKVSIFVYYFPENNTAFFFNDIPKLVERLDTIINNSSLTPMNIPNNGYVTQGYRIRRDLLKDLYIKREFECL